MRRFPTVAALLVAPFAMATAQKTIVGLSGTVMRYHGDTIWMERDTTSMRSVRKGDTIDVLTNMEGRSTYLSRYLVKGDSAWTIQTDGPSFLPPQRGDAVPISAATMLNRMLEMEVRNAQNLGRLMSMPMFADSASSPGLPGTPKLYTVSPDVHLTQAGDTVRYIRGCLDQHPDTTVFLLFKADSVKRLSAPPRMFGQAMNVSLTSKIQLARMQEYTAKMQPALPADLPKAPGTCSK